MTNTYQIKSRLKVAVPLVREASQITKAIVTEARMLLDEDERIELIGLAQELGSYTATIESHLAQFGRISFGAKRFAVKDNK